MLVIRSPLTTPASINGPLSPISMISRASDWLLLESLMGLTLKLPIQAFLTFPYLINSEAAWKTFSEGIAKPKPSYDPDWEYIFVLIPTK